MATEWYRLRIVGRNQQEPNECVHHFRGDGLTADQPIQSAQNLLAAWQSTCMPLWLEMLPETYYIDRLACSRVSSSGGIEVVAQMQYQAQVGSVGSAAQSQQLCPAIRLIPPMGVKSAGHIFLPCISSDSINGNVYATAFADAVGDYMDAVIDGFSNSGVTWNLAIYSRKNNSFSLALSYDESPVIGYQRRRQRPF